MEFRRQEVVLVLLLTLGWASCQNTGQECSRQDRTRGVCRDIRECVDQNGHVESASMLELCDSSTFNRIIACCRKTPAIIAKQKCDEWKREATADGSLCRVNIPLARGGTQANIGEFPHMVSLLQPSPNGRLTHICGGMLVSRRYVLTAAHCINNTQIYVRIGGHDLKVHERTVTVDAEVIDSIIHPEYLQPRRYNDIALLKLRIEVPFSRRVRPACLPYQNTRLVPGEKLIVAGWGIYENGGPTSEILRKAEVSAMDRFSCDTSPVISDFSTSLRYPVGITDSIICADESEAGACSGDSGGPLMRATQTSCEVKEVVGLVSRGIVECKKTNIPGTYTRIEYYLDWIVGTIWADEL